MEFQLVLVIFCFFLLLLFISSSRFLVKETSRKKQAIYHWPLVGGLPSLLRNGHRTPEWLTEVFLSLGDGCGSFSFNGPVFSNFNYLFTCHPQNIEYVLKTNFSDYPKGSDYTERIDILGNGIIVVDDGDSWRLQRRMVHTLFKSVDFRSGLSTKTKNALESELVPFLSHIARQGSVIDLQDICTRLAYDCTMSLVCGREERTLSVDLPHNENLEAINIAQDVIFFRHLVPMSCWKLFRFFNIGKERALAEARRRLDSVLGELISEARQSLIQGDLNRTDLLSMILKSSDASPMAMDDKFVRDMLANLIIAGKDTVASGLDWFFWMVAKTPQVEKKIVNELKLVVLKNGKGGIKAKWPWVFDHDEIKELTYLQAAIYEALRLCPPVPFMAKCVLHDDVLPDGSVVKPGMQIILLPYTQGRMPWIWGEDSMEFKPERWIDDQGNLPRELLSKFFAFSTGPRSCVGKDISFIQMKLCAAAVLFNFHLELLDGQTICSKPSIALQMTNGLLVRIRERVTCFEPIF